MDGILCLLQAIEDKIPRLVILEPLNLELVFEMHLYPDFHQFYERSS